MAMVNGGSCGMDLQKAWRSRRSRLELGKTGASVPCNDYWRDTTGRRAD